jgi:hypothetical protein
MKTASDFIFMRKKGRRAAGHTAVSKTVMKVIAIYHCQNPLRFQVLMVVSIHTAVI